MQGRLLIIVPTYNERENIVQLVDRVLGLYDFADVLVVDDSSKDGTADVVREAQKRHGKRLELLQRSGKNGRGSAVLDGCTIALAGDYTYVMEMDADFSHRPEEIALFLPLMADHDCVIGSRYLPGSEIRDWGWKRTVFSALANRFARAVLRMPLSDYTNGFRCYTREAAAAIEPANIDAKGYVVLSAMAYQLYQKGFRFGEVPTLFVNRRRGTSNLGFHEINEAFFSVLRIRWPVLSGMQDVFTFLVRGTVAAVLDLLLLSILLTSGLAVLPAMTFSGLCAVLAMFFLRRRRWGRGSGLSVRNFLLLYGVVGVLAVVLGMLAWRFGVSAVVAKALAIAALSPVSYAASRRLRP